MFFVDLLSTSMLWPFCLMFNVDCLAYPEQTNAKEIGKTAKIKHTQNKQRKNNTGKNQKAGEQTKTKYIGKQRKK
jgi:hypothetical protein